MNCPSDGSLRARLDGELDETESATLNEHLRSCLTCRNRSEALQQQTRAVNDKMVGLSPTGDESRNGVGLAYCRYVERYGSRPFVNTSWLDRLLSTWKRPVLGAAAAACAFALLL